MKDEWMGGYPAAPGIYKTRQDGGKPWPLMHKRCEINGKHRWMTINGEDVIGKVEWTGGPLKASDLDQFVKTKK